MLKYQTITFTIGSLLVIIGVSELIPALFEWIDHDPNLYTFLICSIISIFFGGAMVCATIGHKKDLNARDIFILTTMCWIFMSLFASLPLYYSSLDLHFTDAFFEAVSGITTTGSTVLSGLDDMSRGVLFWRSFIQWIGGIGVIGFAMIFLPYLKVGGMQLFQAESSDRSDKVVARSRLFVKNMLLVYGLITLACFIVYHLLGMSWFDALNHALTTIPTGGFSTHDASYGYFTSPALQWAATFFMFISAVPFVLFIRLLHKNELAFWQDEQVRAFVYIFCGLTLLLTFWLWQNSDMSAHQALLASAFNIVSVISTTGYATSDYILWGPFAAAFFLFITYLGACAGSTTGGLKLMRLVIAWKTLMRQLRVLLYPNGKFAIRYQGRKLGDSMLVSVLGFLSLYVACNVFLSVLLSLSGLDFETSISGAATAIANVGPGIGSIIGPAGNFSGLPDISKWLLCIGMILGRLELVSVLILFWPRYWRV